MPSVSFDHLTDEQRAALNQQMYHMANAHRQALKLMFKGQQQFPLSVKGCAAYYKVAKAALSESEFQKFVALIDSCTEPDFDVLTTLVGICDLLQHHPDLIQGFGMYLPPDLNLLMQSGELFSSVMVKEEADSSNEMPEAKDVPKVSIKKENEMETVADMETSNAEAKKTQDSVENKNPDFPQKLEKGDAVVFFGKVKRRFGSDHQVFGRFMELLNSIRQNSSTPQENLQTEVYLEVCELFCGHNDLIDEFKVFVPEAAFGTPPEQEDKKEIIPNQSAENITQENVSSSPETSGVSKFSFVNDPSVATVYKFGSYEEHQFFDEVRVAVGHKEVYDNFLRCLMLFNEDIITRSELIKLATSFLGKFPELLRQLKDMLGFNESGDNIERIPMKIIKLEQQRESTEVGVDIDYSSGGRNGANYRALPKTFDQPKCSGRSPLCKEVLNDTWVSFPSWSEDSTFVTSCKTQYEEIIYRCEDERFELDMAITANSCTMNVLSEIQKRMNKMSFEERQALHLDDSLGTGGSTVIHQRALHRLYGDKTSELVEGLKRNPWVAVPIILKRLKAKDDEWKERQKRFNEIWRTQIDQYYLKSLDHQGINFKQNDSKSFRPKSLLNEMEMIYTEKKESQGFNTAHFILEFKEMEVFQDAIDLMLQYLKKLPGVYRDDRRKIELVIRSFIPDFFANSRCTPTDEDLEIEEDSRDRDEPMEIRQDEDERSGQTTPTESTRGDGSSDMDESNSNETDHSDASDKSFVEEIDVFDNLDPLPVTNLPYTLFFVNKTWYVFFRQFHILCDRLCRLLMESAKHSDVIKSKRVMLESDVMDDDEIIEVRPKPTYSELIDKLGLLLSGAIDYVQFEEESRNLFGIHAFVSYTMDKLVLSIVRQLQQIVTDDTCKHCTALFIQSVKILTSSGVTSPMEAAQMDHSYLKKVEKVMEDERCFKAVFHKQEDTLTIELIEQETEDEILDPIETEKWSDYLDEFVNNDVEYEDILDGTDQLPVILPRNLRKMKAYWKRKVAEVENSWQLRQSAKFLKKNIMTNKKRKALALLSHSITKMARRSSNQDGSVHSSNSRAPSVDGTELPIEDGSANIVLDEPTLESVEPMSESVEEQEASESLEEQAVESLEKKAVESLEEQPVESLEDKADMDQDNSEVQVIITTEEDSEKPEFVLVELTEDEMGVQEESIQDTVEIKSEDSNPESLDEGQESKLQFSIHEPERDDILQLHGDDLLEPDISKPVPEEPEKEEAMIVEEVEVAEDQSEAEGVIEDANEIIEVVSEEKDGVIVEEAVQDIGSELDLSSRTEVAVETLTEDEPKEETIPSSPEVVEKHEERSEEESPKRRLLNRRKVSKPYDYSIRTRKNRTNQTYVKRRLKRGMVRSLQTSSKGKRKRTSKGKTPNILDDPTFDYNYFSEMSEDEKIHQLVFMHLDVTDDIEVSFRPGSYKINFVQGCDLYLYRGKSLMRAREAHQSISEIKTSNFDSWHQVWLDRYVTPSMLKFCNDWLLKSEDTYKLVRMNVSDCKKPPYIPYYKYKVRYYKTDTQ